MSSEQRTVRRRVSEHPQSVPGVVVGVGVTIAIAIVIRILTGIGIADPVHPVTYLSLIGGGFGATAMYALHTTQWDTPFPPISFWARILGEGEAHIERYRRQGLYLHVTYGMIVGSFLPRIFQDLTPEMAGYLFAELPLSLLSGLVFGVAVFVVGVIYSMVGLFRLDLQPRPVGIFLANHLVYGLVLGLVTGLWLTVLEPMF